MPAFVPEAALIALREGLEALLIVGLLLGLARRFESARGRRAVLVGFASGVVLSVLAGYVVRRFVADAFETFGAAAFELVAAGAAVIILTYMIVWMGDHTQVLARSVTQRAERALAAGTPWVLGVLVGITTLREGLETVLFYGALIHDAGIAGVLLSGLVGFAISGILAYTLFQAAVRFSIRKVFLYSGAFLVLVAGGLLIHVAHAAADLGWIAHGTPVWDTSAIIPADRADGRILHALVGYTPDPTALHLLLYVGYAGIAGLTLVRRSRVAMPARVRTGAIAGVSVAVVVLGGMAVADGGGDARHEHDALAASALDSASWPADARIGVLYRSHGEPVAYNASTYESFAAFTRDLLELYGYGALLTIDEGTVLVDRGAPFATEPRLFPDLMDAWTSASAGPAIPLADPGRHVPELALAEGVVYLSPAAGPGLGEPDILEIAGLSAYREWLKMGGASPMYMNERAVRDQAKAALREAFGERVVVAEAWHIEPYMRRSESVHDAVQTLKAAGVTHVVDFYLSGVPSDVMDTCMMRPHIDDALADAGFVHVEHVIAPALDPAWSEATAAHVAGLVDRLPAGAAVAVFLTGHGTRVGGQNPCGAGQDRYHELALDAYDATAALIEARFAARRAPVAVYHVYGQGADDPGDGVLSPLEAFEEARTAGAQYVLDVPHTFVGDGFDTLVVLRESWGFEPGEHPYFGPAYETRFTRQGVEVRIVAGSFSPEQKAAAHVATILDGMAVALTEDAAN